MRHSEPEVVLQWRRRFDEGPPKCCHTCDHYSREGECSKYDMQPPADFAASVGACPEWVEAVPF